MYLMSDTASVVIIKTLIEGLSGVCNNQSRITLQCDTVSLACDTARTLFFIANKSI